ncbi:DUF1376 domain-containing protein [Acetobacter syzygii]|uniref:DUF1376 domain-containing protein n=1 Tax=Acetobacter syzygii TaxID=146476 RepID=A0A270BKX8_9PROT|nr:DUF1376 domain-containing protein [Acetobacter syzygii]PAL24786.1 hypothetical protein B9K05_08810 [Acetobacter syzygii]PAL24900.1 hypothetical protein B9K04_08300 [Acetobacter syzygii]
MNNAHTSLPDAAQEPYGALPPPLTPPQSDLRGLPFMPLDTCRLLDSDLFALSTGDGFKCAVALWCKAWQQVPAGSLPHNDRVLAHLSGAGGRWAALRPVALHGWLVCSDGRLYHPVIAEKANQAWKARLAQRARAARRWGRAPEADDQPAAGQATPCHGIASAHARERERETHSLRSRQEECSPFVRKSATRGKGQPRAGRGVGRAPHPLEEQAARLLQRTAGLAPGGAANTHAAEGGGAAGSVQDYSQAQAPQAPQAIQAGAKGGGEEA